MYNELWPYLYSNFALAGLQSSQNSTMMEMVKMWLNQPLSLNMFIMHSWLHCNAARKLTRHGFTKWPQSVSMVGSYISLKRKPLNSENHHHQEDFLEENVYKLNCLRKIIKETYVLLWFFQKIKAGKTTQSWKMRNSNE